MATKKEGVYGRNNIPDSLLGNPQMIDAGVCIKSALSDLAFSSPIVVFTPRARRPVLTLHDLPIPFYSANQIHLTESQLMLRFCIVKMNNRTRKRKNSDPSCYIYYGIR